MWTAGIFLELILPTEKNLRSVSFCKTFITMNNKKLASPFHSFRGGTRGGLEGAIAPRLEHASPPSEGE